MDKTVTDFFTKNPESNYMAQYEYSHGPRLDALIEHFKFKNLKNQRVVDIGGGLGFLGKRLDSSNDYWVIDGANIRPNQRLCNGGWAQRDIDKDQFSYALIGDSYDKTPFDIAFFLETLEHIGNPHHALVEIKKLVKIDGLILISIPTETVWHNAPYPSLLWPRQNFEQFLGQMALPIIEFWEYQPKSIGWPAYHYLCRNAPWTESKMLFHKDEPKFRGVTPLQATNL